MRHPAPGSSGVPLLGDVRGVREASAGCAHRGPFSIRCRAANGCRPCWDRRPNCSSFGRTAVPCTPTTITALFHKHCEAAGLPRIRLHDVRHSYATAALKAGVPAKVISERLGHATAAFTLPTYTHVIPGMDETAAATVAALILASRHRENADGSILGSIEAREGPQKGTALGKSRGQSW